MLQTAYTKITGHYQSSCGKADIAYYVYVPKNEPKAIVQLSHGMCEYVERYEHFAEFLARHDILLCGNDHIGHGSSVPSDADFGYFYSNNGWQSMISDLHTLTGIVRKKYPSLPFFLFGHSMGSFLARAYITKYSRELDGAIICGTGSGVPFTSAQLVACEMIEKAYGDRHRSEKLNKIAFGAYTAMIKDARTEMDWLSRDNEVIMKYIMDKRCDFIFTINGFNNLARMMAYVNDDRWYESVRKTLPILMISGKADPVGNYGRGVKKVYSKLCSEGCDVRMKLYDCARHELVNEINKDEVFRDVISFISETIAEFF